LLLQRTVFKPSRNQHATVASPTRPTANPRWMTNSAG
jgi:hypothetical protein